MSVPELSELELPAIHRLPARPGKIPGLIVKYTRHVVRNKWLENRQKLREKEGCRAFVTENLTNHNRQLLNVAKEWSKENSFQYAWHTNGKIFVRRANGECAIIL